MQFAFVALFDAQLSDVFGAAVVAVFVLILNALFFARIDAADVADQMAAQFAMRVLTKQACLDVHTGEPVALSRESRDLFVREPVANGQGVEALGFFAQSLETSAVARLNVHDLAQRLDGGFQVGHLGWRDLQGVGRVVVGQHDAITVQDRAPRRDGGKNRRPVVFRLLEQFLMLDHLQIHQAAEQQNKTHEDHTLKRPDPLVETVDLDLGVTQFCDRWQVQGHGQRGRMSSRA